MVKVGERVYNWRYGELKVTRLDSSYIYTHIMDENGIVGADDIIEGHFKLPEIVFSHDSFGYWVHDDPEEALLGNNNNSSFAQYQFDEHCTLRKVVFFPIDGGLLHSFFQPYVARYPILKKTLAGLKDRLSTIDSEYKKIKNEFKKVIDKLSEVELNSIMEQLISSSPSEKELKVLRDLAAVLGKHYYQDCVPLLISEAKGDFANDAAYKEYTLLVENTVDGLEICENEFNNLKETLKKIKRSKDVISIVDVQQFEALDVNLFDKIMYVIEEDKEKERNESVKKIKEIETSIDRYKRLDDRSYITDIT